MTNEPNVLRGNIEAGLRLLLKSEKPIYRRTAEVGIEDLNGLFEQLEAMRSVAAAIWEVGCPNWPHPGIVGCEYCIRTGDVIARYEASNPAKRPT